MKARAEHLIALVEDGASLAEAGRVYGIGRERVRQILKAEGITVGALPERRERMRARRRAGPQPREQPVVRDAPLDSREPRDKLARFEAELRAGGLTQATIHAYLTGSSLFVRWLDGDYAPRQRKGQRASAGAPMPS